MQRVAWAVAVALAIGAGASGSAQIGGKPVRGGNPTPGTPQPAPPNLADRITVTGCLRSSGPKSARPADANTPTDAHFVLENAERVDRVPAETGGSPLAASAASGTYRLEGLDSQFSPFVNASVEISGEVKPTAEGTRTPTVLVEFVKKISPACR